MEAKDKLLATRTGDTQERQVLFPYACEARLVCAETNAAVAVRV